MYTLNQFLSDYPNNDACLEEILRRKFPNFVCECGRTKLYKVKNRLSYACACGKQLNPLVGTPMSGTKLPLTHWFFAIYLFSVSKNGVSAAELSRHLGIKYNSAWRICFKLREALRDTSELSGEIEVDETYVRAKPWRTTRPLAYNGRARTVIGLTQRGGKARTVVVPTNSKYYLNKSIEANVSKGSTIYTDSAPGYISVRENFTHKTINHSRGQWVDENIHTQNIENLWSGIKLGLQGTHRGVSPEYLDNYLNFWTFHWSVRENAFAEILSRL